MYFGSVRFFKHLIFAVLIVIIIVPIFLSIFFATRLKNVEKKQAPIIIKSKTNDEIAKDLTIDDYCELFSKGNFTIEQLLNSLNSTGNDISDTLFKKHFSVESKDLDYQKKYPDLYTKAPTQFSVKEKTIYLSFDDGPSSNTRQILDILDKYNIKATFFVVGNESEQGKELLREIVKRGHTIGIHSYCHNYNIIYQSVDAYLDDFYRDYNYVLNATGVKPQIFRFPGGSVNSYNQTIYKQIIAEMCRRGFVYYDWNISGEDASPTATWTSIYNNIIKATKNASRGLILLHDGPDKGTTVTVVEDLIKELIKSGYTFDKLTNDVKPIIFGYID